MYSFTDRIIEENRQLKREIEMYQSTDAIHQMQELCDKRIRASKERENRQHSGWMNCLEANKELKSKNTKLLTEKEDYRKKLKSSLRRQERLESAIRMEISLREKAEKMLEKRNAELSESHAENTALKEEICRLRKIMDHDGTTNSIPTSQTPKDKKKIIPNTREKSIRKKGGQPGHEKHSMPQLSDDKVTDIEEHILEKCPKCGGELKQLSEEIDKDETDYEVKVVRKRHKFKTYYCMACGKKVHADIPNHLKEKNQYGPNIQAMSLALVDIGFVSVKRTKKIIDGMLQGKETPSEGYIGKMQKKMSRKLKDFRSDVRKESLKQEVLYWDDTVVFMNTKRACFRFYGNEKLALYYAHEAKDAKGLESDGILQNLTEKTSLMHDHVKYNYRKEFKFKNIECIVHLERELQRVYNDSGHEWSVKMKKLIKGMIHKRKKLLEEGKDKFTDKEIKMFEEQMDKLLTEGKTICDKSKERYFHADEKNALRKIEEYRSNYFAWIYDFTLPTTNNQAESGLRMTKSKMKISGQFEKEETAEEFALVRTYTETCRKNGINEYEALKRLAEGKPYTLKEILS